MDIALNLTDLSGWGSHGGSAPEPFDALNGGRLAGPQGSHPLHNVTAEWLVRASDGPVTAQFALDHPARVGDGITGTLTLTASQRVEGRSAALRLVGLRLDEVQRSKEERNSKGEVTRREEWVEAQGNLFAQDAFMEPAIPATLEAGQTWSAKFAVPAPRLGPPSAHLGESIVAWALEVRWDVAHGSDHFAAIFLPIAQHPDLIRAGVGKQGGQSMLADVGIGDGHIAVTSPMPAPAGSDMVVAVNWPSAKGGDKARIELHRRTNSPNGQEGIIATVGVTPAELTSGSAQVHLTVPAGTAPSFDGAGLEVTYILRVLVDRRFRPDAAIERPVAIA
jgi:hypothetical protein